MARSLLWFSTRENRGTEREGVPLGEAIRRGLAPDGGLYVPARFPLLGFNLWPPPSGELADEAALALAPFFEGDELERELPGICREAFDFPLVLRRWRDRFAGGAGSGSPGDSDDQGPWVLELFHGPTAAFKDFGARFLARCLQRLQDRSTVLVATSGDTGGAVAAAFRGIPGTRVVVLFPEGRVSPRQRRQLTAWGGNVLALCVRGDFDDCQRLVKQCFADSELREKLALTSANSINPGRLLPQLAYYGAASRRLAAQAIRPDFLVPSGNLGNGLSAVWARKLGFSIGEVTLVTNANRALADFYASGAWRPLATEATLASAMDVGDPSNLERLRALFWSVEELLAARVTTERVEDSGIRATIVEAYRRWGEFACPHTAAALAVWLRRPSDSRVVVATAHASKFEATVEPLLGGEVPLAESLRWILSRSERFETIEPDFAALKRRLLASSD